MAEMGDVPGCWGVFGGLACPPTVPPSVPSITRRLPALCPHSKSFVGENVFSWHLPGNKCMLLHVRQ
jgi:hypothetical protein